MEPEVLMSEQDQKEVLKEALREWLDDKFTVLGKWTARALAAAVFAAIVYFLLWANGLSK
jgi:hypothetical protein